jgi:hypothetical protein
MNVNQTYTSMPMCIVIPAFLQSSFVNPIVILKPHCHCETIPTKSGGEAIPMTVLDNLTEKVNLDQTISVFKT